MLETSLEDPYPGLFPLAEIILSSLAQYGIYTVLIGVLLLLSALISGSEVAFFSLDHQSLEKCRNSNNPSETKICQLLGHPKRLLATILILNNLVNVAIVTISTFLMWEIAGSKSAGGKLLIILTVSVTLAIVFFGEVVPKVFAQKNNLNFARLTAPIISLSEKTFWPLSWLLLNMSEVIEKRFETKGYVLSVDELNQALEITTATDTTEEEKGILKGIVNFGTLTVKQIMKSRLDITALDYEMDFHELMDKINKSGYSRMPVYKETIDKIEGILYIKDLISHIEKEDDFQWQDLIRPGYFVPESKKIDSLMRHFQEKRVHMAIVVDEYGGTSGLITLEDIIEEIVGEINDEFDDDDIAYNKLDKSTFIFEGKTSLNDFCKIINIDPEVFEEVKGESESLGGLLLELNSKLPRVGEKIAFDRFVFTVVSVDARRIKRVRVFIKEQA
jgi:putative hemolysin